MHVGSRNALSCRTAGRGGEASERLEKDGRTQVHL